MLLVCSILNYSIKAAIFLFIKCDPLSLIKVSGHTNCVMMLSYINFATISLEHDSTGSASAHSVTYSTDVIIYHAPVRLASIENGPMKSIAQISNFKLGFTDIKGFFVLGRG